MRRMTIPADEVIYLTGSHGDEAFLIVEGSVEIYHTDESGKIHLADLGPGEIFGEMALLEKTEHSVNARAKETTTVLAIDAPKFEAMLGDLSDDARHVLSAVIRRLRKMNEKFVSLQRAFDAVEK